MLETKTLKRKTSRFLKLREATNVEEMNASEEIPLHLIDDAFRNKQVFDQEAKNFLKRMEGAAPDAKNDSPESKMLRKKAEKIFKRSKPLVFKKSFHQIPRPMMNVAFRRWEKISHKECTRILHSFDRSMESRVPRKPKEKARHYRRRAIQEFSLKNPASCLKILSGFSSKIRSIIPACPPGRVQFMAIRFLAIAYPKN